ncbi:hypothetical protein ACOSP7_030902 [Xanthoceras sorbifolium]
MGKNSPSFLREGLVQQNQIDESPHGTLPQVPATKTAATSDRPAVKQNLEGSDEVPTLPKPPLTENSGGQSAKKFGGRA